MANRDYKGAWGFLLGHMTWSTADDAPESKSTPQSEEEQTPITLKELLILGIALIDKKEFDEVAIAIKLIQKLEEFLEDEE
jgi:hypothetical protein